MSFSDRYRSRPDSLMRKSYSDFREMDENPFFHERAAICVLGFVGPFLKPPALEAMKRDLDEIKARLHYPGALRGLRIKASGI